MMPIASPKSACACPGGCSSGTNISCARCRHPATYSFDRAAADEAVLVPEALEDPLRRVLLLLRPAFVAGQDALDDGDERAQLRLHRRLRAPVTRRHREPHHLGNRPRINPKPPRG